MRVLIRNDAVIIDGYVNVVERESKKLTTRVGKFVEKIKQGAFKKALEKRSDVAVLLNHEPSRILASTGSGTATLKEDQIGLYCRAEITDAEVIKKAKEKKLSGWSFGFLPLKEERGSSRGDFEQREIIELDLKEVSILDDRKTPAYPATSIQMRSDDGEEEIEVRYVDDDIEFEDLTEERDKKDAKPDDGVADTSSDKDETGEPVNRNYSYKNALKRVEIH